MLYPKRGVSDLTRFTPGEVQAKYGLTPRQYPDYAALRGDPSDNLPGHPGRRGEDGGEVGARVRLARRDRRQGRHRPRQGRRRAAREPRQRRAQPAADRTRPRRRPLDLGVDDLARAQWDRDEVHALFDDLQFKVLRERLFATVAAAEPEADQGFDVAATRLGPDEVAHWLDAHARDGNRVGVAFRGDWRRGTGTLAGIALATARRRGRLPGARAADAHRRGGDRRLAGRSGRARRRRTTSRGHCSRCASTAGRLPASPATPNWPATCSSPTSARSTWPTWRCATCTANCAATSRTPASSPSTAVWTSPTTRSPTPRRSARLPCATWPTPSTPTWTRAARPDCSPTSNCR